VALGETETLTPDLSCSKRVHREDAGGDLSRAGEDRRSSQLGVIEGEDRSDDPVHSEVSTGTASGSVAADGAGLIRVEETTLPEDIAPPPTVGDAASEEAATANVSSDPPSQEDRGAVAVKTTEEALARVETSDPPEPAALSMQTVVSPFGTGTGAAAGPLLFETTSGSDQAPQGSLTARAAGNEHDEAPPAPNAAAKGAPGEKTPVATAGSGAGTLSSTDRLQQEWTDTASSAEASGKLQVQGGPLTLAELSRQLSVVKESLRNVGLQFLEVSKTTAVSIVPSTFDFFYKLGNGACNFCDQFLPSP
jgi:hypothetical protein